MSDASGTAPPDPLWEDWDTPPRVPSAPVLHLDGFDGPMDLLLDLAERQRIDLGRISIAELATQFVASMEQLAAKVALERRADWLVIAAQLLLLRAKLLFPKSSEAAAKAHQEETDELKRFDDRMFIRAAVAWLEACPQLGIDVFTRTIPKPATPEGGYVALMEACLSVLRSKTIETEPPVTYQPALPSLWTARDALARIKAQLLTTSTREAPLTLFLPPLAATDPHKPLKSRAAIASIFAAGLELAKQQELTLGQTKIWGMIHFAKIEHATDHK